MERTEPFKVVNRYKLSDNLRMAKKSQCSKHLSIFLIAMVWNIGPKQWWQYDPRGTQEAALRADADGALRLKILSVNTIMKSYQNGLYCFDGVGGV